MAGKSAALTINVIANAAKAKAGFKEAEKGALDLKGQFTKLTDKLTGPAGVVAGITAIGAFAMKAAGDFQKLAKSAHDLGVQTGLGTEMASRWVAVADDMGVAAESLQAGFKAINKDIESNKWQKYGIATKGAGGEARKANDIFLDTLDVLGKIKDPTERAKVGTELLGKAWGGVAPLVGKSREEYERMLQSVEAGQVITAAEYQKAEKLRLAQDKLADAWGEVSLSVGEFVAGIAPAIAGIADFLNTINIFAEGDISKPISDLGRQLVATKDDIWGAASAWEGLIVAQINARSDAEKTYDFGLDDEVLRSKYAQEAFNAVLADDPRLALDMAQRMKTFWEMASDPNAADGLKQQAIDMGLSKEKVDAWVWSAQNAVTENERINEELKKQNDLVDGLTQAWEDYLGLLDMKDVADNAQESLINLAYAVDDPTTATNEFADAQKKAAEDVARFIQQTKDMPKDIQLQMLADLQSGDLAAVYKEIEDYKKEHPVTIPADVALNSTNFKQWMQSLGGIPGSVGSVYNAAWGDGTASGRRAAGGPVMGSSTYLVGENGPELFTSSTSGTIIPNGAFGMAAGGTVQNITINMPAGSTGAEVLRALQQEARRTGQLALPVSSKTVR